MRWSALPVVCFAAVTPPSLGDDPADFFDLQTGSLPVIVTAPHGGSLAPSDVSPRVCDEPGETCLNDVNTNLIADRLGAELEALTGSRPIVIINRIDRDYIDLNRDNSADPDGANASYEDGDARPYYDYYHNAIGQAISVVLQRHGRGILLDIHGQSLDPDVVFRGTQNGQTVARLITDSSESALTGPASIFGQLESLGYNVDPSNVPIIQDRETTFAGGFTVRNYGSLNPGGIDALQIEFGRDYRVSSTEPGIWQETAADLAVAVRAFADTYLAQPDLPGDFNGDGAVDAADYSVWRDNDGSDVLLPGDTTPGRVAASDYQDWIAGYGSSAPVASEPDVGVVPEPCGLGIVTGSLLGRPLRCRLRRACR